jgi:hypothetical protein
MASAVSVTGILSCTASVGASAYIHGSGASVSMDTEVQGVQGQRLGALAN